MTAIGIDLGTTYSAVARVTASGRPEIVKNREGEPITPSVVLFAGDQPLVGTMAKRSVPMAPADAVEFVKRFMGDPDWRFASTGGAELTAEQVSAVILKRLKEDAEIALGQPCPDAVVTVPAYFDDARRQATRDAAVIAGLNVLRIINEPTAAALAYGLDQGDAGTCLVYDLGGGTFDVTVLRIADGVVDVIGTDGDRNLGGFDFDNALMWWVNEQVAERGGPNLFDEGAVEADLREKCENAKRSLTTTAQAVLFLSAGEQHFQIPITRARFEELTSDLIDRTRDMMEAAVKEAGLGYHDLDRVLLVGGSTRMPMVRTMVERTTGRQAELSVDPDQAVALGAAVLAELAAAEAGGQRPVLDTERPLAVHDVTSQTLGVVSVEDVGGSMREVNSPLITKNAKVPHKASELFRTVADDQTELRVRVTEGDDEDLAYLTIVGESLLRIPPYPAGAPVEIVMSYDIDGMIHVEVIDRTSNTHLGEFEIDRTANLDRDEVDRMRDAMATLGVG